jgi:adenine-specific DNA-methyltransferase
MQTKPPIQPAVIKTRNAKRELGQFLTPSPIAQFMASLFSVRHQELRMVDAGAGEGTLSSALVDRICAAPNPPDTIKVTAYELDSSMLPLLRHNYERCLKRCAKSGIEFSANIINADFVECASEIIRRDSLQRQKCAFNAAIMNPPYRKISSNSRTRRLLKAAGIETSNLYSAFVALTTKLLSASGELVAITPRSFCNGPYFRPFRELFLDTMSLRQIHLFESRSTAFSRDAVLQENVIVHAVKSREKPTSIVVSVSSGEPGAKVESRKCKYGHVVVPSDPASFIHLITDKSQLQVRGRISRLTDSLPALGLTVSTGRVVDFRATELLRSSRVKEAVPLIRPCHFNGAIVQWPVERERKPCAIVDSEASRDLLVPKGTYVLVKRFTAKEERRRVVACVYDPARLPSARVGFENHLNYFHSNGEGFDKYLAKGLTAFLNSTAVDVYFRHFSGHTQVNATDLRSLKYPSRAKLVKLGQRIGNDEYDQLLLDDLVNAEVL